jgi:anhydro-N-acetylmuramic acid kinase
VCEDLVQRWLQEPYLQEQPPKSTGRELFGRADLNRRWSALAAVGAEPADALATLAAFSAAAVAQELARGPCPVELLVAGGGARNGALMQQLRGRCTGMAVRPLAELGIADSQRESLAFALLAWWHWRRLRAPTPAVTGAERTPLLGVCAWP